MSERETHPIDELFRRKLAEAEAAPPPSVWLGVQAGRGPQRRPVWFWLNGLALLLLPAGALVAYLAWPVNENALTSADREITAGTHMNSGPVQLPQDASTANLEDPSTGTSAQGSSEVATWPVSQEPAATDSRDQYSEAAVEASSQRAAVVPVPNAPASRSLPDPHVSSDERPLIAVTTSGLFDRTSATTETAGAGVLGDQEARYLRPLGSRRYVIKPGMPLDARAASHYVLPSAEWLVSIVAGWYDVDHTWKGDDPELTEALQRTEARSSSFAPGIMLERKWRSGWGIGAGVFHERSEQQFRYVDTRTQITSHVVTNWLVTLDSEVVLSEQDTIDHITKTERTYEGVNRRSITRIPLEGAFHRSTGRFHYGLRAGVALEFTSARPDHSLVLDREEGRIAVATLDRTSLRQRHPLMLVAMAGAEVGYTMHERWSLWLNPVYMSGAAPLSRQADAWTSPSRFGLQIRLTHHIAPCRKK